MEQGLIYFGTFIAGVLITLFGTYLIFRFQRTRKRLGYAVLFADRVVRFKPGPGVPLQIMVRRDLLDIPHPGTDEYMSVGAVWGFRILVQNTGNATLENQDVFAHLDHDAVVVSAATEPSDITESRGVMVDPRHDQPNTTRVHLPYLNPGEELTFWILSIDNASGDCRIVAAGPGLQSYDIGRQELRLLEAFSKVLYFSAVLPGFLFLFATLFADKEWFGGVLRLVALGLAVAGFVLAVLAVRRARRLTRRLM